MTVGVRRAGTEAERADALAVRRSVFVEEQGVPESLEVDGKDGEAVHFVAYADADDCPDEAVREIEEVHADATTAGGRGDAVGETDGGRVPVGAGRLREVDEGVGKVERIAVVSSYRGRGAGRAVMTEVEATAERLGFSKLVMHAQTSVEEFYRDLGYETASDEFEEAGISHVEMEKSLD